MASRLHQIARMGALKEGEDLFRIETTSGARKVANALDGMKRTPLHLACWAGHVDMIALLLRHRADCMATAQDGFTPLHFCSQAGCAEGCRLLLEAGAKADAKLNKNRKTALHLAAVKGHAEVVRVLVEAGASTSLQNSKGETPLDVASTPDVRVALASGPPNNPAEEQPVAATATPGDESGETGRSGRSGRSGIAAGNNSIGAEEGAAINSARGSEGAQGGAVSGVAGSRTTPDKSDVGEVGAGAAQVKEELNKNIGGTGGGGNGVERIGSLAERRRKKRKLAQVAAAVGKGISLSHLEGDGDENEVAF
ncbi:unnamed protein product [Ascophyllum nodosum]